MKTKENELVPQDWTPHFKMCLSINKMYGTYQKAYDGLEKIISALIKSDFYKSQKRFVIIFNQKKTKSMTCYSPEFVQDVKEYYNILTQKPTEKGWIDIMRDTPVLYGGTAHFFRYAKKYIEEDKKLVRFYIYPAGKIVTLFHVKLIQKVETEMRENKDFFTKSTLNDANISEFEIFEPGDTVIYHFDVNSLLMN